MPSRIPAAVMTSAQQKLPPAVLAEIEKSPNSRLAPSVWATLDVEQQALVRSVRKALMRDDFATGAAPTNALAGELAYQPPAGGGGQGVIPTVDSPLPGDAQALELLKANPPPQMDVTSFKGVNGQSLRNLLRSTQGPGRVIDYKTMRAEAYTYVFNRSGRLLDHYSGQLETPAASPDAKDYNWEHIFAQSWNGLKNSLWQHHAFNGVPTDAKANALRGHLPFGEVVKVHQKIGYVTVGLDQSGRTVAEVDRKVRGDIALRSLWMYTEAPEYLPKDLEFMLPTLVKWLIEDPPNAEDLADVVRAEQVEQEMLYYAHCPKDLVLRAFLDVLGKHQDSSPEIKALYDEAMAIAKRDDGV